VNEVLQSSRAKAVVEKMVGALDVKSLCWVAYGLNYLHIFKIDIFPYLEEVITIANQVTLQPQKIKQKPQQTHSSSLQLAFSPFALIQTLGAS
jgi:hypothetical protein